MDSDTPLPPQFQFLADALLEVARERSVDRLLQIVARRALEMPESAVAVVWLVDTAPGEAAGAEGGDAPDRTRCLYAVAGGAGALPGAGQEGRRLPDALARIPLGEGPIGGIAAGRTPLRINDLDREPGVLAPVREWLRAEGIRGFSGTPILHGEEVLGVLGVFSHGILPAEATWWGRVFADHIGGAIANARAFEEVDRLRAELERQNAWLREEVVEAKAFGELVGQSAALGQVVGRIDLVAPTDASVLILGETGTGKELVAHEIHRRSRRSGKPLVRVNCASIPRDLYESEFFGHARGSFTGAVRDRAGRFETAEGGTLFLDEIAEVPLELQAKLLRALQEKRYERVGEDRTRRADVRIIAATNRDLEAEVAAGRFRRDLYYRLNVFPIHVAPLRERRDDIPLLAQHFAQRSVRDLRCPKAGLTREGVLKLQAYDWPGNVRELQNVIERAVILARGGVLRFDLPVRDAPPAARGRAAEAGDPEREFLTEADLRRRERENLLLVLGRTGWRVRGPGGAADLLGVKESTLQSRMRAMGLKRPG